MQPIEIALFGAVIALAAGLIGYIAVADGARAANSAPGARRKRARRGRDGAGGPPAWSVPPASASTMRACSSVRTTRAS